MKPNVTTGAGTAVGLKAFTANGTVHPRDQHTFYYFEYGSGSSYGWRTESTALPARRTAHYFESWDHGTAGWDGHFDCKREHLTEGGPSPGFLRITEQPLVINAASELMVKVFGDKGRHARVAVGCPSLPLGAAVEVDGIFELEA